MTPISVVIITFNEEQNIANCIDSIVDIADDIVVVDSFSTDKTCEIAESKGARIVKHKFEGHIEQKNFAITQAKFPNILSLDADEFPDKKLITEIRKIKTDWEFDGYTFNRLNNYCGKWIKHGAWYPDIKLRFWDSRKGKWDGLNPHDKYVLESECVTKHLTGNLLHYSYNTIEEHYKKADYFSTIAAETYFQKGKKSSWLKTMINPISRFLRDYIFKLGFLDGKYGFIIARISAYEVYLKYKKTLRLQEKNH